MGAAGGLGDHQRGVQLGDVRPGHCALFRVDGTVYAIDGACSHAGGPLAQGEIKGGVVTCPWHGFQFDVTTGQHQTSKSLVHPSFPVNSIKELIALEKKNPGKINFASYTPGTLSHVMGLQLNQLAGLDMNHVGYKGSPPALQDVMGGSVQFMFDGLATSVPNIRGGKLRAFAVTSPQRSHALPDVPTMAELGFKDMTRTAWLGLWAVPGHPDAALKRIREETLKALATPAVRDRLMAVGLNVNAQNPPTPEQMVKSLHDDYESVGTMLKAVNYKPE